MPPVYIGSLIWSRRRPLRMRAANQSSLCVCWGNSMKNSVARIAAFFARRSMLTPKSPNTCAITLSCTGNQSVRRRTLPSTLATGARSNGQSRATAFIMFWMKQESSIDACPDFTPEAFLRGWRGQNKPLRKASRLVGPARDSFLSRIPQGIA